MFGMSTSRGQAGADCAIGDLRTVSWSPPAGVSGRICRSFGERRMSAGVSLKGPQSDAVGRASATSGGWDGGCPDGGCPDGGCSICTVQRCRALSLFLRS